MSNVSKLRLYKNMFHRILCIVAEIISIIAFMPLSVCAEVSTSAQANLQLEHFTLSSGEGGSELWHLQADSGNLMDNGNEIQLDMPVVHYLLGKSNSNNYLVVKAQNGRVTDNKNRLELWGNVQATNGDKTLSSSKLVYYADKKCMIFPDGALIDSRIFTSKIPFLSWNLTTNCIEGKDNINTTFKPYIKK